MKQLLLDQPFNFVWILIALFLVIKSFVTVQQGTIAVITIFGKYRRVMGPGLNMRIPFIEVIFKRISTQNRSVELEFQAVTQDQDSVYFNSMLLYSVMHGDDETLKRVAFKFLSEQSHMEALVRTSDGAVG